MYRHNLTTNYYLQNSLWPIGSHNFPNRIDLGDQSLQIYGSFYVSMYTVILIGRSLQEFLTLHSIIAETRGEESVGMAVSAAIFSISRYKAQVQQRYTSSTCGWNTFAVYESADTRLGAGVHFSRCLARGTVQDKLKTVRDMCSRLTF